MRLIDSVVAADPRLAAEVADYRRADARLRLAYEAMFADAVPERFSVVLARARRAGMPRRRALAAVLVAALLGAGAGAGWWLNGRWHEPGQAALTAHWDKIAGDAIHAHRLYATATPRPVDIIGVGRDELSPWLAGRLGLPHFVVPDIAGQGFRLLGARLLPAEADTVALIMFENGIGDRLTLYVRNGQTGETRPRWFGPSAAGAVYWVDDNCSYVVTGLADRDRLERLTHEMVEQMEDHDHEAG